MPKRFSTGGRQRALFERVGRVSYMFLLMNYSAVAGLMSALTRRKVWR